MNNRIRTLILLMVSPVIYLQVIAQTLEHPVFSDKSHPTLYIDSIVHTQMVSVFHMSVVNQLNEGDAWFCADENIIIQNIEENYQVKLYRTEGIPVCPEMHHFKEVGESLNFKLFFPRIPDDISSVDLIENCEDNCFKISEIILDPALNADIKKFEEAVLYYRQDNGEQALSHFIELTEADSQLDDQYLSLIYYIIPVIYLEEGKDKKAIEWFEKLNNSDFSFKDTMIAKLRENPFFVDL